MADDLRDEIKLGVDASGVETGVRTAKRAINDLGKTVADAGKKSGDGFDQIGKKVGAAGQTVDRVTRNMVSSLQRQVAAAEAGGTATRAYQESIARLRGANMDVLRPYLDQLDAARDKTRATTRSTSEMGAAFSGLSPAARMAGQAIAAMGITASIGGLLHMADASTNLASRLSLVTDSAAELSMVQGELFRIAQNARVSFVDLGGTYAQVARSTKELGVSQTALLGVIETISKAVTISGGSAQSAQAALTQLSQGFAAGALRGEELNSVMEQTPRLAQAIADGMGIGIGQLRAMGQEGQLTAERVLGALQRAAVDVDREFGQMAVTIEQATTRAVNSVTNLVGALDRLTGTSSIVAAAVSKVSSAVDYLARDLEKLGSQGPLREAADEVQALHRRATLLKNGMASGFYPPSFQKELDDVNAKLAVAKQRFRELDQELGGVRNPRDQSGYTSRGTSYANEQARQAKLRADANAFLLRQAGVTDRYIKDMEELIRLNREGVIVGDQYTAALKRQQDQLLRSTGARGGGRGGAASTAVQQHESEIARIRAMIAEEQAYIGVLQERGAEAERLTAGEKMVIKLQQELQSGLQGTARAYKERALAEAQQLVAAEKIRSAIQAQIKDQQALAKAQEKFIADRDRYLQTVDGETEAMRARNSAADDELMRMGMTTRQLAAHEQARIDITIAKKRERLETLALFDAGSKEIEVIKEQIKLLEQQRQQIGQRADRQEYLAEQAQLIDFWQSVDQTAHDVFVNIFEDGAGTFKRLGQTLKSAVLDMLYQLTIKRWIINIGASFSGNPASFAQAMGGQGGGLLGNASNLQSAYSWLTGGYQNTLSNIASFFGFGGAAAPTMTSAAGSMYAGFAGAPATHVPAITGFSGTPIAGGSTGVGAGVSAAGLAAIAAPLIIGSLVERNSRDRYGGAAYATSNWQSDAFVNAVGADFNALTGDIPNRDALIERAIAAGIERSTVDLFNGNDRALLHYVRMAEDPNRNEFGGLPDPRKLIADGNLYNADFYRGQGFASPQEMGWWNNKGGDLTAVDPRVVEASRALSLSIVAPLSDMARMLGDAAADFRVTTGFANRGKGAMWGALDIQRGGERIGGFGQGDFANVQEYMRAVYSEAMDAFSAMDLPEWARGQVEGAQTAMDALTGDKLGQEAAALYQQTTAGIAQMYQSIQTLIDIFPDFSGATQDSVHALQEAIGGMDALQSAYASYIGAFWSEAERADLARAQISASLEAVGLSLPATRDAFRDLVEAQDLNTEAGREAFAVLMSVAGAFAEISTMAEVAFEASGDLAGMIRDGLLGSFAGADLGAAMAQTVQDGIYNAIAGHFAAQITDIIVAGIVNPVISAAVSGSSASAAAAAAASAVSQASIDQMIAQAQAVANAAAAILNDPAFQDAISSISSAVSSIKIPAASLGYAARATTDYSRAVSDSGRAAQTAADQVKKAWASIADTLLDEVARIRGEIADMGDMSLSYWQSQLMIDTAAARAGDQDAAGRLQGISRNLLTAAEAEASSALELQQMRAWVAQSLQDTAGYATAYAGGAAVPRPASSTSPASGYTPPQLSIRPMVQDQSASNKALEDKLNQLIQQNEERARVMEDMQRDWLRIVRRWDESGMPAERVAV